MIVLNASEVVLTALCKVGLYHNKTKQGKVEIMCRVLENMLDMAWKLRKIGIIKLKCDTFLHILFNPVSSISVFMWYDLGQKRADLLLFQL